VARDVSIVIPTWNGRHILAEFLPSVFAAAARHARSAGAAVEIVIVDDGSTDGTSDWVDQQAAHAPVPIRVVRHERNLGFGAACNRGIQEARHPLILLLNNDVSMAEDAIAPLAAHFERPSTFAVHCRVIDDATDREVGTGQAGRFARGFLRVHQRFTAGEPARPPFPSIFASAGSAMFSRRLFLDIGGFDPLFSPYYYEDVELSYRAWKRGFDVAYEPASAARHRFSSTIGRLPGARVRRTSQRNRLLFHWIHLHDRAWWAQHVLTLPFAALGSILVFRPYFALGVVDALRLVGQARQRRERERREARRTDRDVAAVFEGLEGRPGIHPIEKKRPA
jgi:GT2 family glycosyltransferase